jgi:DNA-binding Xre family transcriptional regulator
MYAVMEMSRKNQLKSILASRDMSIYALAKRIQMPHHNVKKIVESETIPDGIQYKTLRSIADALGITIEEMETEEK